jgi:phenylacetate-CoA ligase
MLVLGIAEACERGGFDPADVFSSYRALVHAGEPLGGRAQAVVDGWGVPVFEHTSVGDVGTAFECPQHDGLHFWEDDTLVENIAPESTAPMADGERGELVATALVNRTTPLIRYRSDDLVRLTRAACACGRTHARLWPVGRKGDGVEVGGRTVLPIDVWRAVESVDECGRGLFQIVREAPQMDRLVLRVGYGPEAGARLDTVREAVVASVAAGVGLAPEVELVPEADLLRLGPPHKIPRVVER